MNGYKKLSKKEINKLVKDIYPRIYIDTECYIEKFKQVYYFKQNDDYKNGIYLPYIISSFGRLFAIRKNKPIYEMKLSPGSNGYNLIILNSNEKRFGTTIHRLVAVAFIKKYRSKKRNEVNHIDGIKTHNFIWNLEWVTSSENKQHAIENNLTNFAKGENSGRAIYTTNQIKLVCKMLEENMLTKNEISTITKVDKHTVNDVYKRRHWKHISCNYDFTKRELDDKHTESLLYEVCKMLEENKSMKEISKITGLPAYKIGWILNRKYHKNISNKFDFSNYNYGK